MVSSRINTIKKLLLDTKNNEQNIDTINKIWSVISDMLYNSRNVTIFDNMLLNSTCMNMATFKKVLDTWSLENNIQNSQDFDIIKANYDINVILNMLDIPLKD